MLAVILMILLLSPLTFAKLSNESEVSMVTTGGNSELKAYNSKTVNKLPLDQHLLAFGGHYTYGEAARSLSARNWDFNTRDEYTLSKNIALTFGQVTEGNTFQGFKTRYNLDLGSKYYFLKNDQKNLSLEVSYRYSIEDRIQPANNLYAHKARVYTEWSHQVESYLTYGAWLEYIPNFSVGKDFLLNGETSITTILNSRFSLKVGYKGMYRGKPAVAGLKNYDFQTTTSLVAKF